MVVVHTTRRSLEAFTTVRHGVAVTQPLRTLLDLAGEQVEHEQLRNFVNHGIALRLFTVRGIERSLDQGGHGVTGTAKLRRLVAEACAIESVAEAKLVEVLVAAGIPRPVTQFEIREGGRFVARVDLAWPANRVALELDGFRFHSDAGSFVSDRERGNRIVARGWALLRTTPAALRSNPHLIVSDVRAALAA